MSGSSVDMSDYEQYLMLYNEYRKIQQQQEELPMQERHATSEEHPYHNYEGLSHQQSTKQSQTKRPHPGKDQSQILLQQQMSAILLTRVKFSFFTLWIIHYSRISCMSALRP